MRLSSRILIPTVLAIWAGVGLGYVGFWQGGDTPNSPQKSVYTGLGDIETEGAYPLNSGYKDPFLGNRVSICLSAERIPQKTEIYSKQ